MPTPFLEALRAPIAPERPAGDDLALAPELDELREARKGDAPGLAQGDWVRELRAPQWPRVRELCETILAARSKDLQVSCWYAEALTIMGGFQGLAEGLEAVEALLDQFWDTCHPGLEDGSAEERTGRLEWLDASLALAVKQVPLTQDGTGGYSWLRWDEARRVDQLGMKSSQARDEAVAEGKLTLEDFLKAAQSSGAAFQAALQDRIRTSGDRCASLQALLDRRFGPEGPGLEALAEAIHGCGELVLQTRRRLFPEAFLEAPAGAPDDPQEPAAGAGPIRDRRDAIRALRAAAAFFRGTEPHSPVALLVERAAGWAEMPLEQWLSEVIKDAPTLTQLRELLSLNKDTKTI